MALTGHPHTGTNNQLTLSLTHNHQPVTDLQPLLPAPHGVTPNSSVELVAFHDHDLAFAPLHLAQPDQSGAANLDPITPAAATDPTGLPIYDISARHEVINLAIAHHILAALDLDHTWIEHVHDRPNHDRRHLIDPAKLETHLGWKPTHDFAAGIADTVGWYVENQSWWENIFRDKGELLVDWSQHPTPAH